MPSGLGSPNSSTASSVPGAVRDPSDASSEWRIAVQFPGPTVAQIPRGFQYRHVFIETIFGFLLSTRSIVTNTMALQRCNLA